jgi:4-hydroxy-tetrahydrodipicolinate synthase
MDEWGQGAETGGGPMTRLQAGLAGVSGVHVTAYDADGAVDDAATAAVVDRIAAAGVHIIVSGGNTGEFFALSSTELQRVQHAAVRGNSGRSVLVGGIGRSLPEARQLAISAEELGFDALMIHHPSDPFASPDGIVGYVKRVADMTRLPIIPYIRSPVVGVKQLIELAGDRRVAGVKFAVPEIQTIATAVRETKGMAIRWVCGLAESWAPAFYAAGAAGFTSGLVNIWPQRSLAIHSALSGGDLAEARRLIDDIIPFEALRATQGNGANVTVVKEALNLLGRGVGPVRPPGASRLPRQDLDTLKDVLSRWGVLTRTDERVRA